MLIESFDRKRFTWLITFSANKIVVIEKKAVAKVMDLNKNEWMMMKKSNSDIFKNR